MDKPEAIKLYELNARIHETLSETFRAPVWIEAETSDLHENYSSGHCYLEFIEKDPRTGQTIARAKGTIWAGIYRMLKPYFEKETGQSFSSGIKVSVQVNVQFHELYGYSLNVTDIDPSYTLGDMERRRREILRRLEEEGVLTLNKELSMPDLPQHIAVISSANAAGYGDFMRQLEDNAQGYAFYTALYPAMMQGEQTGDSIRKALDKIFDHQTQFDVVAIIRGGGATADLNSFDSYELTSVCAQYPLPIITGIGHERDDTILDRVAHTRLKTPTAVAEYLISCMDTATEMLSTLTNRIAEQTRQILTGRNSELQKIVLRLPVPSKEHIHYERALLTDIQTRLTNGCRMRIEQCQKNMELMEQQVQLLSPETILQRGYSLTLKNGVIQKNTAQLQCGDRITTRYADGESRSIIDKIIKGKE